MTGLREIMELVSRPGVLSFAIGLPAAELFPREAYRRMFERLLEAMPERNACRLMVELLSMAHERACEAELADLLAQDLDEGRLPDIAALRTRFSPDESSSELSRLNHVI